MGTQEVPRGTRHPGGGTTVIQLKRLFGHFGAPSAFELLIVGSLLAMTIAGLAH